MSWQDIFGNAARLEHLKKILAEGKFPHAVIFSGAAGIGKRKIAITCAKVLLCENPSGGEACGVCESCKLMKAGSHPDFYIVEPEESKSAPNIKIGQIRDLQAEVALQPNHSNRRVVIIDGAELMNAPAANCLLKTLEEPTGQTIFILTTANRAGLLMTVRSRCVTVNFDKLSASQIKNALENRGVESGKAEIISLIADGSFGRALQLESSGGYEIRESALNFLERLCTNKIDNEEIFQQGALMADWSREQFSDFVTYIQKILRDIYLIDAEKIYNPDLKAQLHKIKIPETNLLAMFDEGTKIQRRLKSNANLRLMAESYFFRLRLALNN